MSGWLRFDLSPRPQLRTQWCRGTHIDLVQRRLPLFICHLLHRNLFDDHQFVVTLPPHQLHNTVHPNAQVRTGALSGRSVHEVEERMRIGSELCTYQHESYGF